MKTVFDANTGELLGAHLVGPHVTELVATFALARTLEATEAEILATVFAHPTLAEAVHEATAAAFAPAGPAACRPDGPGASGRTGEAASRRSGT